MKLTSPIQTNVVVFKSDGAYRPFKPKRADGKPDEARMVAQIRRSAGYVPELSFVAEANGTVVGITANVKYSGIDPAEYQGFAFGFGMVITTVRLVSSKYLFATRCTSSFVTAATLSSRVLIRLGSL